MMKNNKFPWKKTITGSIILVIIFALSLALLSAIANNAGEGDYYWILLLVWGGCFAISLIVYWAYTYFRYRRYNKKK